MKTLPITNLQLYDIDSIIVSQEALEKKYTFDVADSWTIENPQSIRIDFSELTQTIIRQSSDEKQKSYSYLHRNEDLLVDLTQHRTAVSVRVVGNHKEKISEYIRRAREIAPPLKKAGEGFVDVKFWNQNPTTGSPYAVTRKLEVPSWEQIEENYSLDTRTSLENLMHKFRPKHGGQLIIWHGIPGTGKTYSLRALCDAWKKWATTHYVVDPEYLFGNANYLTQMLMMDSVNNVGYLAESWDEDDEEDEAIEKILEDRDKWKLIIMEDTGELLTENSKAMTGQSLSRLLNLADGFIGQGLKVLVLITTNEKLERFNSAVSRPGRTAATIEFGPFEYIDAVKWAADHKVPIGDIQKRYTLAELYGLDDKLTLNTVKKKATLGFAAPTEISKWSDIKRVKV